MMVLFWFDYPSHIENLNSRLCLSNRDNRKLNKHFEHLNFNVKNRQWSISVLLIANLSTSISCVIDLDA